MTSRPAPNWRPRLRPEVVLRRDDARGEDVVIQPERLARLNATAAAILRLCDGTRSVESIRAAMAEAYGDAAPARVAESVDRFLASALSERWIA